MGARGPGARYRMCMSLRSGEATQVWCCTARQVAVRLNDGNRAYCTQNTASGYVRLTATMLSASGQSASNLWTRARKFAFAPAIARRTVTRASAPMHTRTRRDHTHAGNQRNPVVKLFDIPRDDAASTRTTPVESTPASPRSSSVVRPPAAVQPVHVPPHHDTHDHAHFRALCRVHDPAHSVALEP
jgi:hypothetical protein